MRQAHEGGHRMKALILILAVIPAFAQVTGTVTNRTTGKPQLGATVGLYKLGTKNGLELIDQAKSDAQGKFTINQTLSGPNLIRTAFGGITYNHMLPPGSPSTNIPLDVYDVSKQPNVAKVSKHMVLFEPSGGQVAVSETYLVTNEGKTAWYDPDGGTLKIFVPPTASKPEVKGTAPEGAPIGAPVNKTSQADTYAIDFAVKPGNTRFDVNYIMPYKEGDVIAGKIPTKDENTYLIVPSGVELKGDGLNDLGTEPRTQAHIWGLSANAYKISLIGSLAPAAPETDPQAGASDSAPKIEAVMPRLYKTAPFILACTLGVLALGLVLLYRASPTRGTK
jgi:hypothetical protein